MRITNTMWFGCLVACAASIASAQTSVDRSFKAVSKTCDGVEWSAEALAKYPTIASACQGVEERNGKTYVKFQGELERNIDRGKQLEIKFKDGGALTVSPPPETALYVDGKKKPVSDLRRGDELNFYIAEDRFEARFDEEEAQPVIAPVVARAPVAEDESERMAATLPSTAAPLPLLALSGFLTLGLGGLLTLYRRRRQ
jgi:LPXTG-motif cell wall-anchored protein